MRMRPFRGGVRHECSPIQRDACELVNVDGQPEVTGQVDLEPGIERSDACRLEILGIAGDDRQPVDKRSCRDQCISV